MQIQPQQACPRPISPVMVSIALGLTATLMLLSITGSIHAISLLALSTLVSEDLTCIAAGQFIQRGDLSQVVGVAGCLIGIFVGDLGLWLLGRLVVRRIIVWPWLVKLSASDRVIRAQQILQGRVGTAIFMARFIPGLRLPMYVAMGVSGVCAAEFATWTFLAAIVWTPLIVLLVAHVGQVIVMPLQAYLGMGWIVLVAAIIAGIAIMRFLTLLTTEIGRAKVIAKISRIWRWEFWPSWLFYLPAIPWIAWLSVRHRGFMTITVANPGIPYGGFVGESKIEILKSISSPHVIPSALLRGGRPALDRILKQNGWAYPIILKPDAGQRGAGVKLIHNDEEATTYLQTNEGPVLAQPYHPGPFEAGIFYYRLPNESTGHILSITDKRFSQVTGDGRSTLEQLIWRHPRYRMQASTFLTRHADDAQRVLTPGEHVQLAVAGNHCQGTMFCDGAHLWTPQLEATIDRIAQTFKGFYFGRFDVRYSNVEQFKAGQDLAILELNGITSESTNLYDPSWSLIRAYRQLFRQWNILFQIGAMNRAAGVQPGSLIDLIRDIVGFYRSPQVNPLAD